MSNLKLCPFCGSEYNLFWKAKGNCSNERCVLNTTAIFRDVWNTRPIEDKLQAENDKQVLRINATRKLNNKMLAEIQHLKEVLEKLACLGNGPHHGNSDGNIIAIQALKESEAKDGTVKK